MISEEDSGSCWWFEQCSMFCLFKYDCGVVFVCGMLCAWHLCVWCAQYGGACVLIHHSG